MSDVHTETSVDLGGDFLTTQAAARILEVHESSVKRWCDTEVLRFDLTKGGHRRLSFVDIITFARSRRHRCLLLHFEPYAYQVWNSAVQLIQKGNSTEAKDLVLTFIRERPYLIGPYFDYLVSDQGFGISGLFDIVVAGVMSSVGSMWESGSLSVGGEHIISNAVVEALHYVYSKSVIERRFKAPSFSYPPRTAIIGSVESDFHVIPAIGLKWLLETHGWRTVFVGASSPIEDFAPIQKEHGATLMCISLTKPLANPDGYRLIRVLAALYDHEKPYRLALGGSALEGFAYPDSEIPFVECKVFKSISALANWQATALQSTS